VSRWPLGRRRYEQLRSMSSDNPTVELQQASADSPLSEDPAFALLKRSDLPPKVLEQISKNGGLMKIRKVRLAVVKHPRTPHHVSLPLVRHLFTFDLMELALTPVVPADIKIAAEESLINRLETISTGERMSLARRASGRVAAALLFDSEVRVILAALENSRLTESMLIKALVHRDAPPALVEAACHHAKWSLRPEIRIALLRNEKTPLALALEFSRTIAVDLVREILQGSRLSQSVQACLINDLEERSSKAQEPLTAKIAKDARRAEKMKR